jgi:hypothetical protein
VAVEGAGERGVKVKFDSLGVVAVLSGKVVPVGDVVLPAGKGVEVGRTAYCGLQLDRMSKREAIPK